VSLIHAIYEKGVFRPKDPVDLPEHTTVIFEVRRFDAVGNGLPTVEEEDGHFREATSLPEVRHSEVCGSFLG
jgi:predicted DNA-binding antitoxin AbrB/MazE fold protein